MRYLEGFGRCLGGIFEVFRTCLGGGWEVFGRFWQVFGRCLRGV